MLPHVLTKTPPPFPPPNFEELPPRRGGYSPPPCPLHLWVTLCYPWDEASFVYFIHINAQFPLIDLLIENEFNQESLMTLQSFLLFLKSYFSGIGKFISSLFTLTWVDTFGDLQLVAKAYLC